MKIDAGHGGWQRLQWVLLVVFLCLPELALLGFFATGAVLSASASMPRPADAVVVLGGDVSLGGRYARGRDLVLAGYGQRLILLFPSAEQVRDAHARLPGVEVVQSTPDTGSWGEAEAVRQRMLAQGLRSVIVVSDPPHMLRLRYTWGSILRGTGLDYTLVATSPPWWPGWRWWRNPQATSFVGNEVLKLGGYVLKYRFGLGAGVGGHEAAPGPG